MRIGPITISLTSGLAQQAHEAQTLDLRRNRCIAGQSHDIQALRATAGALRLRIAMLELLERQNAKQMRKPGHNAGRIGSVT